jgi:ureidoglycolate lyase
MRTVFIEDFTPENFQPYGQILDASQANPRLNFCVDFKNERSDARLNLALICAPMISLPFVYDVLERHPYSEQTFLPLGTTRSLIVVARSDHETKPDFATLKSFIVPSGLGIVYRPDTWHTGMAALDGPSHFAMLIHEAGTDDDCHYLDVPQFEVRAKSDINLQPK